MKLLKIGLRFWITITSMIAFITGWIMLAHAPKPVSASSSSSVNSVIPTLEPLRPLSEFQGSDDDSFQSQPFFNSPQRNQARPFFSTGGS